MTWIIAKLVLGGVPQRFAKVLAYLGAAVAIALLVWAVIARHDRKVIREHEAEVQAEVQAKASEGAVAASSAAADTVSDVEAGNQRMREAAAKSDDPLKAALDAGRK
jgi:uncharacterized membrane protein